MKKWIAAMLCLACALCWAPAALAQSTSVTASTPLYFASDAQKTNAALACQALSYVSLEYGDSFSFNALVGPREAQYGYVPALNGRGVTVVGGGVAQVASTLYLALLQLDDIEYNSLYFYGDSYAGSYVSDGYYIPTLTDYNRQRLPPFTQLLFRRSHHLSVAGRLRRDLHDLPGRRGGRQSGGLRFHAPCTAPRPSATIFPWPPPAFFGAYGQYGLFSFNDLVGPRQAQYGYTAAVNGRGVTVVGGGVAQVASTVYLAVKDLSCVTMAEKKTCANFNEYYVADPADAILTDYTNNIDFSFYYTGSGTLVIYTYLSDTECVCEVYEY